MADYLDRQGAARFFDKGNRYGAVCQRMVDALEGLDTHEKFLAV